MLNLYFSTAISRHPGKLPLTRAIEIHIYMTHIAETDIEIPIAVVDLQLVSYFKRTKHFKYCTRVENLVVLLAKFSMLN